MTTSFMCVGQSKLIFVAHADLRSQATVLLAVDVSVLAIPGAAPTADAVTAGFVASLCSTVTSIGCIVVGLLLVNEDHTNPKNNYTVSIFTTHCTISHYSLNAIFIVVPLYSGSEIREV